MVTEVEVAAGGSVASGHQRRVLDAWLQDARRPHNQEAQYQQKELPQTPQQLPTAWMWTPLGRSRQKQLEHPEGGKVHVGSREDQGWSQSPGFCPVLPSPPPVCLP